MYRYKFLRLLTIALAAAAVASCTVSKTPTPLLHGPSELGLSLSMSASPDTLSFDGASQSLITVEARDANGQPAPNVGMRAEIVANDTLVDFGSLSARSLVTGANGKATVTYTAPNPVAGPIPTLAILFTPTGSDAANQVARAVSLRLVPPGTISAGGPTPSFTFTPPTPTAFTDVQFDASASTAAVGSAIVTYGWTFGDGSSGLGVTPTHRFAAGTWSVVLTTTDSNGVAASVTKQVPVGVGAVPTADFSFSPTVPTTTTSVNFNGGLSKAGSGHSIVKYDWNFGSGSPQSGVTVSKLYDTAGTYAVTLTVTDEVGQQAIATKSVTVTAAATTTAEFTTSPTSPKAGVDPVNFDGNPSRAQAGATITSYTWIFGDGSSVTTAIPTTAHTYASANTYTARLIVTDSTGTTATVTHSIGVVP
jgi:PKD repeat protein